MTQCARNTMFLCFFKNQFKPTSDLLRWACEKLSFSHLRAALQGRAEVLGSQLDAKAWEDSLVLGTSGLD